MDDLDRTDGTPVQSLDDAESSVNILAHEGKFYMSVKCYDCGYSKWIRIPQKLFETLTQIPHHSQWEKPEPVINTVGFSNLTTAAISDELIKHYDASMTFHKPQRFNPTKED